MSVLNKETMDNFDIENLDNLPLTSMSRDIVEKPTLVIRDAVLFPQILTPLVVVRDASLAAIEIANAQDSELIVVTQQDAQIEEPEPDEIYTVGVIASIVRFLRMPDGTASVLLQGHERDEIDE